MLQGDLPFIFFVAFVADDDLGDVLVGAVQIYSFGPFAYILKSCDICEVKTENNTLSLLVKIIC